MTLFWAYLGGMKIGRSDPIFNISSLFLFGIPLIYHSGYSSNLRSDGSCLLLGHLEATWLFWLFPTLRLGLFFSWKPPLTLKLAISRVPIILVSFFCSRLLIHYQSTGLFSFCVERTVSTAHASRLLPSFLWHKFCLSIPLLKTR